MNHVKYDRHLCIRITPSLKDSLMRETEALHCRQVSLLVRHLLKRRHRKTGVYSKEDRDTLMNAGVWHPVKPRREGNKTVMLSIKLSQELFDDLEKDLEKDYLAGKFESTGMYVRYILEHRFARRGALHSLTRGR